MEIVTLAHVTLNRPGSASGHGFIGHREIHKVLEVPDSQPQTLRELVENLAEAEGESRSSLQAMQQVQAMHFSLPPGTIVFNVQGPSTQYSTPYAHCFTHPALKVGKRYFRLEEIQIS